MPKLYLAEQNVSWGQRLIRRGAIVLLSLSPEKEAKLRSALAEVIVPLEGVPNWRRPAARLAVHGYTDVQTVLTEDDEVLAKAVGARLPTVQRWKQELSDYLQSLSARGG